MKSILVKVTTPDDKDPQAAIENLIQLARNYGHIDDRYTFEIGVKAAKKPRKKTTRKK